MSGVPEKFQVATAQHPSAHFPMEGVHVTTNSFFRVSPILVKYLPRTMHGKAHVNTFTRCVPMPSPVLSQAKENTRYFLVPARVLWPSWYSFIVDTIDVDSNGATKPNMVPTFKYSDLLTALLSHNAFDVEQDEHFIDLVIKSSGGTRGYKWKNPVLYSVLKSCGYEFPYVDFTDLSSTDLTFSALPLLAYLKVIVDWYVPSAYASVSADVVQFLQIINTRGSYSLTVNQLNVLLSLFNRVTYDSDRFVDAFDTPTGPNNGLASAYNIPDVSIFKTPANPSEYVGASVQSDTDNDVPPMIPTSTGQYDVTQYALSMLKSLTQFLRRHQLSGGRAVDRWLADFGLGLNADKSLRSQYLGSDVAPVQFGDVMSHADTAGASLGDYAGKGLAFNRSDKGAFFDCAEDDCFLVIINTTIPKVCYSDGYDRQVRALSRLDYYQPDFDGIGTEGIEVGEVCVCAGDGSSYASTHPEYYQSVNLFGFAPRYSWMKCLGDKLSGDFGIRHLSVGLDSWHLFRRFDRRYSPQLLVHGLNFVEPEDASQYSRIFNIEGGDEFIKIHHISLDVECNMLPYYDDYLLSHGKGKKVKMRAQGETLN